jgi:hypothetical protein
MGKDTRKKHVATGRPHGGYRPGAGRPAGSKNVLPTGAVKAIKALRLRVPDNAPEEAKELADRALSRVADVMNGKVHSSIATPVLKAATHIREEICGPLTKKIEVEGKLGLSGLLDAVGAMENEEKKEPVPEVKPPAEPKGPIIRKRAK